MIRADGLVAPHANGCGRRRCSISAVRPPTTPPQSSSAPLASAGPSRGAARSSRRCARRVSSAPCRIRSSKAANALFECHHRSLAHRPPPRPQPHGGEHRAVLADSLPIEVVSWATGYARMAPSTVKRTIPRRPSAARNSAADHEREVGIAGSGRCRFTLWCVQSQPFGRAFDGRGRADHVAGGERPPRQVRCARGDRSRASRPVSSARKMSLQDAGR